MSNTVVIPYVPRSVFLPYHRTDKRYVVSVAHRRSGKTVARINKLIRAAVACGLPSPRYAYIAPYFVQAKDIAWSYLKHYAAPLRPRHNESELAIYLTHNSATIRLYGAENIERLRGLYFDGVCLDEAQDISPSALSSVILPTLVDRQGWLDVSGTPKGWTNLLGGIYRQAGESPDEWFSQLLRSSDTNLIPPDEIARLRRNMPDNQFAQEFECSFDAAITGAYYAKDIITLDTNGRITSVPYDKSIKVDTWWDLGVADSTVIWFVQVAGREIRVIDYYEASGYGLDHYASVLDGKGYLYGKHIGPHDIMVREFGTGRSRIETASSLGINFVVAPQLPIKDGIDAVRMVINRCIFDRARTEKGLTALRQYHEDIDTKRGVSKGPRHDWCSHAADAFRYGVVSMDETAIRRRADEIKQAMHYPTEGGWMT